MSKRLIVFTGKGGVGKTSLAIATTLYLKNLGKNVLYNNFDQFPNYGLCDRLSVPHLDLELEESAVEYMAQKLGSHLIATWIMKTPFFASLLHMLPGLGHIIVMGHIINKLEKDPSLTVILDSPSSGHAMTMFESTHNFKKIFGSGLLFQDLNRMQEFLLDKSKTSINIVTIPTEMAVHEAQDLKASFLSLGLNDIRLILNSSLPDNSHLTEERIKEFPDFLKKKYDLEKEIIDQYSDLFVKRYAHVVTTEAHQVISELSSQMKEASL
ncbi:MAG: hypothetical protein OHK0056_21690 [Bacteriovoracaceae bacterium]